MVAFRTISGAGMGLNLKLMITIFYMQYVIISQHSEDLGSFPGAGSKTVKYSKGP